MPLRISALFFRIFGCFFFNNRQKEEAVSDNFFKSF